MRKIIEITSLTSDEFTLYLHSDNSLQHSPILEPQGTMIVDSDQLSFLYILDNSKEYVYLYIRELYWKDVYQAVQNHHTIYLVNGDREIELLKLGEELMTLLENIKDNSNYGAEMLEKVETVI